jgi:hypothetical protein
VIIWGFWEKRHWIPNAALYRADWSPRPAAIEWQRLVRKDWWTDVEVKTDASGTARVRGFLGDYEVVAGGTLAKTVLPLSGTEVTIRTP